MLLFSVIAREFRQAARKKRAHGLRLLFGGAMAVWFCIVALKNTLGGGEALGRAVYDAIMWPLAYGLMLLAPALAAPSIAQERKEDTLGLLFLTKLRPYHIVLAKFTARLMEMLWLVLLALPFLALPILFGGAGHEEAISDALILLGVVVFFTAAGVCASAFFRSATVAFLVAMAFVAMIDIGLYLNLNANIAGAAPGSLGLLLRWARTDYAPGEGLFNVSNFVIGSNATQVVGGTVDVALAIVGALTMLGLASWKVSRLSHISAGPSKAEWRRRLRKWNRTGNWVAASVFVTAILLGLIGLLHGADRASASWGFWHWQFWNPFLMWSEIIAHLIPLVIVAMGTVGEKEGHTLENLVCTPLSNASLVNRKIAESWWGCWGWYLFFRIPLTMVIMMGQPTQVAQYLGLVLQAIAYLSVILSVGAYCSAYAKTFVQSLTFSIILVAVAYVVLNKLSLLAADYFRPSTSIAAFMCADLGLAAAFYLTLLKNFRRFAARQ